MRLEGALIFFKINNNRARVMFVVCRAEFLLENIVSGLATRRRLYAVRGERE